VRDGQGHRGKPLCGRVDDHHRVFFPQLAGLLVADAAPEIDDFGAAVVGAAGAAKFVPAGEVLRECLAHSLEPGADVPLNVDAIECGDPHE
jgi:hypothetical protein